VKKNVCDESIRSHNLFIKSRTVVRRADRSIYHALGYATVMYLQAALTFEAVSYSVICCILY